MYWGLLRKEVTVTAGDISTSWMRVQEWSLLHNFTPKQHNPPICQGCQEEDKEWAFTQHYLLPSVYPRQGEKFFLLSPDVPSLL